MIKAAFFDIDGTLLSFRTHCVSDGTRRAFGLLHSMGVRTFLSTGRPWGLVPKMPLAFEGCVSMNGGLVFTLNAAGEPDQTLLRNPIADSDSEAWVHYARRHNICTMMFTERGMMASQLNETGRQIRDQLAFPMPQVVPIQALLGQQAYQIIALMPPERDHEVMEILPHCRLPRWHPAFTDIVAAHIDKAQGLAALCRHFGIRQDETMAFGDGGNDVEMLQWAGIGVAMGNADECVKKKADMVTKTVDDEGIEHAVNQLFNT